MAPPISVNKSPVPVKSNPVAPPLTPDQELGRAALAVKDAKAQRDALAAQGGPKLAAAQAKYDAAKKTFDETLAKGMPSGPSRKAAAALYERRERMLPELEKARATEKAAKVEVDAAGAKASPALKSKLAEASQTVKQLEAALGAVEKSLVDVQDALRRVARGDRDGFESQVDGASKTIDAQRRVYGAPLINVTSDQAFKHDVEKLKKAFEFGSRNGAFRLWEQLKDTPVAYQRKLLAEFRPQLESAALGAPDNMMLGIIDLAPQPERQQLAELVVKKTGRPMQLAAEAARGFADGSGVESAAAILKATPRGKARELMIDSMTLTVRQAQNEFTSTKNATEKLLGDFTRTTFGFARSFPQDKVQAYRDDFMAANQATFAKSEAAAAKYLKIAQAAQSGSFDGLNVTAYDGGLRLALGAVKDDLPALLETKAGKELLDKSLTAQAAGEPSFLDSLSSDAALGKGITDTVANAMVKHWVLAGGPSSDPEKLAQMVKRNAKVFGISDRHVMTYMKLVAQANDPKLDAAARVKLQQQAMKTMQAGNNHGRLGSWATILLTGPSLINGWYNFKDQNALQNAQTILGTMISAKEVVSLMNDAKVLEHLGNAGNAIGAVLSFVQGGMEIADGKLVDGGTSIAAGVGGVVMLVPGGQLLGAAIILGSTLARLAWGSDPAAELEGKAEKMTQEFLVKMGVKGPQAEVLADVLQKDLRSVGAAIPSLARELQMRPEDLMNHLAQLDPQKLRQFVDMVKMMPANDKWEFTRNRGNDSRGDLDATTIVTRDRSRDGHYEGPRSLQTAAEWMTRHGFVPPKGKYEVWHGDENERPGPKAGFGDKPRKLD